MAKIIEKEKIKKIVRTLPENAHIEDAMEKLYLLYKVEKGCRQADAGQIISHKEVKKRLHKWLI
ncbi:MAG: hypothetical protein A2219_04440 [Elusimicrobia bacterium RIFOXYA2_FULL_50_26]|nr:MAG: hypothetical protein A2219_04440 [Elusimicrobia bacterium RIFOXYA2_FULL_50_26]OGS24635.1 MAG: hypothetical protein A2314_05780 [Elusimicrobia bacterium RIFOXYB2_FULL_50_12]